MPGKKVYGEVQPPDTPMRTSFGGAYDQRARLETAYNNAINPRVLMPTEFQTRPDRHADASYWRNAADSFGHGEPISDEERKHDTAERKKRRKKMVRLIKKKKPASRVSLTQRVSNHVQGTLYDLKHFDKLPGDSAIGKIRYACTRDERGWTLAGIGLVVAIIICVIVAISQSGKTKPSLLRAGDTSHLGSSFRRAPMIDIVA